MVLVQTRPLVRQRASAWPPAPWRRDMEAVFRDLFGDWPRLREQRAFPAVNVTQDPDHFYLRAELPGMEADGIDLSVDGNKVTIRGTRSIPAEGDVSFHRRERVAGSFARTVSLPADVHGEGVEAHYRDGILTVSVPKAPESKPRQIAVQSS